MFRLTSRKDTKRINLLHFKDSNSIEDLKQLWIFIVIFPLNTNKNHFGKKDILLKIWRVFNKIILNKSLKTGRFVENRNKVYNKNLNQFLRYQINNNNHVHDPCCCSYWWNQSFYPCSSNNLNLLGLLSSKKKDHFILIIIAKFLQRIFLIQRIFWKICLTTERWQFTADISQLIPSWWQF